MRARLTPRTVALYVSTPSNPTGRVIPRAWLEALAEFARREDLWLLSDEVYEDYVYGGEHVSVGRVAPERTLTRLLLLEGLRHGGQPHRLPGRSAGGRGRRREKISTHTFYSAPTAGQLAGLRALRDGAALDREALARSTGRWASETAAQLGLPAPQGSTFLFLDVRRTLDERGHRRASSRTAWMTASRWRLARPAAADYDELGAALLHGGAARAGARRGGQAGQAARLSPTPDGARRLAQRFEP